MMPAFHALVDQFVHIVIEDAEIGNGEHSGPGLPFSSSSRRTSETSVLIGLKGYHLLLVEECAQVCIDGVSVLSRFCSAMTVDTRTRKTECRKQRRAS